jgi:Predicted membrane protein (DUF2306)
MQKSIKKIVFWVFFLLGLTLAYNALTYANFDPNYNFLKIKQAAVATGWYLPSYYSHVLLGGIILIAGFIQLHPVWGLRSKKLHRFLGFIYVFGILFFAAPGGLLMAFFIGRGPLVLSSFLVQGGLWIYFTARAFQLIKQRKIEAHRYWMWKSFSLTAAAITLRIYIFFASYWVDLSEPWAYAILSWASWLPNWLLVEYYFYQKGYAIN